MPESVSKVFKPSSLSTYPAHQPIASHRQPSQRLTQANPPLWSGIYRLSNDKLVGAPVGEGFSAKPLRATLLVGSLGSQPKSTTSQISIASDLHAHTSHDPYRSHSMHQPMIKS